MTAEWRSCKRRNYSHEVYTAVLSATAPKRWRQRERERERESKTTDGTTDAAYLSSVAELQNNITGYSPRHASRSYGHVAVHSRNIPRSRPDFAGLNWQLRRQKMDHLERGVADGLKHISPFWRHLAVKRLKTPSTCQRRWCTRLLCSVEHGCHPESRSKPYLCVISVKMWTQATFLNKINRINRIGPRTDPRGTHKIRLKGWNCDLYTYRTCSVVKVRSPFWLNL